jgi:hypothetical protein
MHPVALCDLGDLRTFRLRTRPGNVAPARYLDLGPTEI